MDGRDQKAYVKDVIQRLGDRLADEAELASRDAAAVTGDTAPFHDAADATSDAEGAADLVADEGHAFGPDSAPFEPPPEVEGADARFAADGDDEGPVVGGDSVPFDDGGGSEPTGGA